MRVLKVLEREGLGFGGVGFERSCCVEFRGLKVEEFLGGRCGGIGRVEKRECLCLCLCLSLRSLEGGGDGEFRRKRGILLFLEGDGEEEAKFCWRKFLSEWHTTKLI